MKKITFLAAALVGFAGFAQTTVQNETDGTFPTEIFVTQVQVEVDCSQEEPSNAFENGFGDTNLTTEVSDDFIVADGETFSVESATFNLITGGDYPTIDVRFYEDAGGVPFSGAPVVEFLAIAPTSQDVVGSAFGRDVLAVVVDFPAPVVFDGQSGSETIYWMSVNTPAGTGADSFYETSTASASVNLTAFRDATDQSSAWEQVFSGNPTPPAHVFSIVGQCDPLLSVGENIGDLVSIFPNPTQDVLNVSVPSTVKINNVVLYDVVGKNTGLTLDNGTINTSSLARGIYILNIQTDRGALTEKIVKQ
jgi:hypothetical protein